MKNRIKVEPDVINDLAKVFKCTPTAVWYALSFQRNSDQAKKIRHLAMQKGGVLIGPKVEPETSYDADGTMTQTFGDRVKLTAFRGMVTVYVDGKATERTMCKEIPEFVKLQNRVKRIASEL